MSWLTPPPLKVKPPHPFSSLPVPKRKWMGLAVMAIPTVIGFSLGVLVFLALGFVSKRIAGPMGDAMRSFWAGFLVILGWAIIGWYVGYRTLLLTLMYGATEERDDVIRNDK